MSKKIFAIILVLCMVLSMAACVAEPKPTGTQGSSTPSTGAPTTPSSDPAPTEDPRWNIGSLPIVNEPTTIKILCTDQAGYVFDKAEKSGLWAWLTEKTGITIEIESYSTEDMATKLPLIMADPDSHPDIFLGVNFQEQDVLSYGQNGQLLEMDEYLEKYCPNIQKWFDTVDYAKGSSYSSDGHLYALAKDNGLGGISVTTYSMRADWLEQLGKEAPKTLEELGEILALIAKTDINGDGKLNEYGISGSWRNLKRVLLAWVGMDCYWPWEGFLVDSDEDGNVFSALTSDQCKYLLQTLNKWYEAGYIDPDLWTQAGAELNVKINENRVFLRDGHQNEADGAPATSVYYAPFTSKVHDEAIITASAPYQTAIGAVSANTKNPEVCMMLLDYLYSEEGSMVSQFGLEGVDYKVIDKENFVLESMGKDEGYTTVGKYKTGFFTCGWVRDEWAQPPTNEIVAQRNEAQSDYYKVGWQNYVKLNEEEAEVVSTYMADLGLYMDDYFTGFITGKYDIDTEWDSYCAQCLKMGEQELEEAYQGAYDRWIGAE